MRALHPALDFSVLRADGHPVVKICGLMRPVDARVAAESGADLVGMVFAPSKRQISIEDAIALCRAVRDTGSRALTVGVFVNESPGRIREIADTAGLDVLQLSGDETPGQVSECAGNRPVIKALRFQSGTGFDEAAATVELYLDLGLGDRLRLLVDAYDAGSYGGTGQSVDHSLATRLSARYDLVLAGGLTPSNVAEAIARVRPWGVDVSSGVERGGVKDPALIEEFVRAAHAAG